MYPKSVYLDYASSSNERLVDPVGYEQIKDLIKFYQVCKECKNRMDDDPEGHLLVGKNLCISCVLKKHSGMRFLGPVGADSDGDITYAFLNEDEIVYTITANTNEELRKDIFGSIAKAGFTVPEYYVPFKGSKDNPVKLGRYNWTVYGKLTSSVIVLEYSDTYPTLKAVFLCYKGGEVVELNKRNLAFKQMFERAKQVIERTKHKKWGDDYYFHPDGYEVERISDEMLYPIIAQFEAAVWDVQKAFMPVYQQPELIEATPQPLEVEEVNETPDPVNIETEHVNEIEESLTQDQPDQVEQETLSVADSIPEEIAPVLPENSETEQGSPQVDTEIETGSTPEETPTPEEPELNGTNVPKSRKRGRLSLVSQEEQTNG